MVVPVFEKVLKEKFGVIKTRCTYLNANDRICCKNDIFCFAVAKTNMIAAFYFA